jgi:2-polyprenyl-3-methyl-5-hydroxy-6-metoxy-1,4-benzoquinol methylase
MYHIKQNYNHRSEIVYFDDTSLKDEWQNEVYQFSRKIYDNNNYSSVIDFGCGSGYKLIKYFSDVNTIGIDLKPTVTFLKNKYPHKQWTTELYSVQNADIFIASDVIEHMDNPDVLIEIIKKIKPKEIILSTPDRNLQVLNLGHPENGPPVNKFHVREWNMNEFNSYIGSHFNIESHVITNTKQCTQMIHARMKN